MLMKGNKSFPKSARPTVVVVWFIYHPVCMFNFKVHVYLLCFLPTVPLKWVTCDQCSLLLNTCALMCDVTPLLVFPES